MILSLDFDDTYTRDPAFWDAFIVSAQKRGHTVYCVTMRTPEQGEQVRNTVGRLVKCFFTSMQGKSAYMWNQGIKIDVWIDDMPIAIVEGIEIVNDGKIYE